MLKMVLPQWANTLFKVLHLSPCNAEQSSRDSNMVRRKGGEGWCEDPRPSRKKSRVHVNLAPEDDDHNMEEEPDELPRGGRQRQRRRGEQERVYQEEGDEGDEDEDEDEEEEEDDGPPPRRRGSASNTSGGSSRDPAVTLGQLQKDQMGARGFRKSPEGSTPSTGRVAAASPQDLPAASPKDLPAATPKDLPSIPADRFSKELPRTEGGIRTAAKYLALATLYSNGKGAVPYPSERQYMAMIADSEKVPRWWDANGDGEPVTAEQKQLQKNWPWIKSMLAVTFTNTRAKLKKEATRLFFALYHIKASQVVCIQSAFVVLLEIVECRC